MEQGERVDDIQVNQQTSTFLRPLISEDKSLRSAARRRKSRFEFKTVHHADVENEQQTGWEVQKVNKTSTRLKRPKPHARYLEDRAWSLFYSMGYPVLNGDNLNIHFEREDGSGGRKQIDVYAEDNETVLVTECKSRENRGRRSLQKDLHETVALQGYFRKSINSRFKDRPRPKIVWVYDVVLVMEAAMRDLYRRRAAIRSMVEDRHVER